MVEVKAKRNCKFGYEGQEYVFKEGEKRKIDVPVEKISERDFEILSKMEEKKVNKKKDRDEDKGGGS